MQVVSLSANKLLAQLGQAFPMNNSGFTFNENSYDLTNTIVLLLSHSGGTFSSLNVRLAHSRTITVARFSTLNVSCHPPPG